MRMRYEVETMNVVITSEGEYDDILVRCIIKTLDKKGIKCLNTSEPEGHTVTIQKKDLIEALI